MLQRYKISFFCCNLTTFFGTIHSIFIKKPLKHIKTTFYLNITETITLLEGKRLRDYALQVQVKSL